MTRRSKEAGQRPAGDEKPDERQEPTADSGQQGEEQQAASPASVAEELEQARREAEDYRDRYLRVRAEMENYKRRIEKSYVDLAKSYKKELFLKILRVMDNLERALAYQETGKSGPEALAEGLRLTHAELNRMLEQEGLKPIQAEGEIFDPHRHEAIQVGQDRSSEEGRILAEVQRGYTYQDDVLRPSQVVVNKPAQEAAGEER